MDAITSFLAPEFMNMETYRRVLKEDLVMCTHEQAFKNNAFKSIVTQQTKVEEDLENLISSPLTSKAEKSVFRRLKSTLPPATSTETITDPVLIGKNIKLGNEYQDLFANDMKLRGTHDEYYRAHGVEHFYPDDGAGTKITRVECGPDGYTKRVVRNGHSASSTPPTAESLRRLRVRDLTIVTGLGDQPGNGVQVARLNRPPTNIILISAEPEPDSDVHYAAPDFGFDQSFSDNLKRAWG